MKTKLGIYFAALALVIFAAGCGDDETNDSASDGGTTSETTGTTGGATESSSGEVGKPPKVTGSLDEKPEIATPSGDPPTELIVKDLKKGTGKKARSGDTVEVQYVGVSWSSGEQFDASWDREEAFQFDLGEGFVIAGWDEGVEGMRVGGRRLLVVPPDKGYGEQGSPGAIRPNETLVFVVDLVSVK